MSKLNIEMKPTPRGIANRGVLAFVDTGRYGFNTADLSTAEMVKGYLKQFTQESQQAVLGSIVSQGMQNVESPGYDGWFPTIKTAEIPQEQWINIDGAALAVVINEAKKALAEEAGEWTAMKREQLLKRTIAYLRDDINADMDGAKYVASMPVEFAEFITDCWLALKATAKEA